jgi:uncharacterized protein YjbJ (UPF0337 family)
MAFNENIIKGKWLEIKGEIQKAWGKLTNDEIEKTKGDATAITGLIQQKYGDSQEAASKKVSEVFKKFEGKKEKTIDKMKDQLDK